MATLDQWFEEIIAEVPGATDGGLHQALRRTFRVFCQDSGAYILEQESPISIVADQADYDVMAAFPTLASQDDHIPLYIWAVGLFDDYATDGRVRFLTPLQAPWYRAVSHAPSYKPWGYRTTIQTPGVFTLTPVVSKNIADALSVFVAFRFKDGASFPDDAIPEPFASHWFDIIRNGAIGNLCAEQDKPYTNPAKAVYHQRMFRSGIARARDEARNQFNTSENGFVYPVQSGWVSRGYNIS